MRSAPGTLDLLTHQKQNSLRELLIAAVAQCGRTEPCADLERLAAAAPIECLPEAASLHRVSGTVLRGLDGVAGVPEAVRVALDGQRVASSLHHLLIAGVLITLFSLERLVAQFTGKKVVPSWH